MTENPDNGDARISDEILPHGPPQRPAAALLFLIGFSSLVELVLTLSDYGLIVPAHLRGLAYQNGGFWSGLLRNWQPNFPAQPVTMFFTYVFLHAGLLHVGMNMITLWSFGQPIIRRIGQMRFLALYLVSALGGAAAFGLLSAAVQPMVGASGALFGLVGAWIAWDCTARYVARRPLQPILWMVLGLVALNVIFWWAAGGALAWQAHLGGFVTGWIAGVVFNPPQTHPQAHPDTEPDTEPDTRPE
jgi:membrane associated rhomboid family serine protease